jgi:hypothetical protein
MCHVANIDWLVNRNHADVAYPRAVLILLGLGARAGMNMHVICTHTVIGMHVLIVLMARRTFSLFSWPVIDICHVANIDWICATCHILIGWVFVIILTWHIPRAVLILLGLYARAGTNDTYAWDLFPKGPIFKIHQDSSCGRNILIQQIHYNRFIPKISRGFRIWSHKWHTVTNSKVTR